ncbi:MAG: hypothetical protein ACLPKB_21680, partial [Xanthobacteraceae bacterium]
PAMRAGPRADPTRAAPPLARSGAGPACSIWTVRAITPDIAKPFPVSVMAEELSPYGHDFVINCYQQQ